jgi:hypothetical protein
MIIKPLKYATFSFDEVSKTFIAETTEGGKVKLNKVYAFALMRFIIRISQRNWYRKKVKH